MLTSIPHGMAPWKVNAAKCMVTVFTGVAVPKLSEYVEMAATEYLRETGLDELAARWIAAFFQDGGVQDDYPRQDVVAFSDLVQKALTKKSERAGKQTHFQLDKIIRFVRHPRKP